MAWAPPTAKTLSMPQSRAAQAISGAMLPSARAGVQSITSRQPATRAGTASISTVEKSGALPPGM